MLPHIKSGFHVNVWIIIMEVYTIIDRYLKDEIINGLKQKTIKTIEG